MANNSTKPKSNHPQNNGIREGTFASQVNQRDHSGPDVATNECCSALEQSHAYVTGTMRSGLPFIPTSHDITALNKSFLGSSPEVDLKSYSVYPPSPPSSAPSSPSSIASDAASIRSNVSKSSGRYTNPLHAALGGPASPIKPLLTPRNSQDGASNDDEIKKDANILAAIFPKSSPIQQLPATKIELAEIVESWEGAVLENPAMGTRTLYVSGGSYESVNMRESICDVLELAEEKLGATGVVMVLEKDSADIGELIHQLLYVGGTITSSPFAPNPDYILVALDLM